MPETTRPGRFDVPWIRARVDGELQALGRTRDELRGFPTLPGAERHFVVGADKLGVLWSLSIGLLEGAAPRVFAGVRFHEPAAQLRGNVHGGAISAVIDAFAAACGVLRLGWNLRAVTKEQTVRFRRAVHLETDYLVRMCPEPHAPEVEDPARQVVVTGTILGEDETVHALSRTLVVVPR